MANLCAVVAILSEIKYERIIHSLLGRLLWCIVNYYRFDRIIIRSWLFHGFNIIGSQVIKDAFAHVGSIFSLSSAVGWAPRIVGLLPYRVILAVYNDIMPNAEQERWQTYFFKVAKCGLFLFFAIWLGIELVIGFNRLILLNQINKGSDQIDIFMNRLAHIKEVIYKSDHSIQGGLIVSSHRSVKSCNDLIITKRKIGTC